MQPPRYVQHPQQQAAPSPSVAESSAPAPGRKGSPVGTQAREVSSAAGAAGGRRPQQHQHDPQALQEFLRMHAAFNNSASRAQTVKVSRAPARGCQLRWAALAWGLALSDQRTCDSAGVRAPHLRGL